MNAPCPTCRGIAVASVVALAVAALDRLAKSTSLLGRQAVVKRVDENVADSVDSRDRLADVPHAVAEARATVVNLADDLGGGAS